MKDKFKGIAIAVVAVAALAVGGAAVAGAGDDDKGEVDKAISGSALGKAKAAALEHTGGGTVSATEGATRRATTRSR